MTISNLYAGLGRASGIEEFIPLVQAQGCRLEQIVSHGQPTRAGEWYDQADPEWVMLVRGTATLRFEAGERLELRAGDYLVIPAHKKHRVDVCSEDAMWLALHYRE